MKPFEQYLRLLLALHRIREKCEDEEFDLIQDQMDKPWYEMNKKERKLIAIITEALYGGVELPDYLLTGDKG